MTDWFRSWHGAPTDGKWRTIAKRAGVSPSLVVSIAWVLLDRASQAERRGSIDGIDIETVADFLDCGSDEIERVIAAMHDKTVLDNDRFTAWDRRQPKREREDETAAARKAAERARKAGKSDAGQGGTGEVTPSHATSHQVTPREEESRVDNPILTNGQESLPFDSEKGLYACGEEILGRNYGPVVTQLRRHYRGDIVQTRQTLEESRDKHKPMAFLQGIIHGRPWQLPRHEKRNSAVQAIEELKLEYGGCQTSYPHHA